MTDQEPVGLAGVDAQPTDNPGPDGPRNTLLQVSSVPVTLRNFLIPYALHFRRIGWRVDAAAAGATQNPELVAGFDRVHDVSFSRSIRDVRSLLRSDREIGRLIKVMKPDIVHVHTPIAAFITRLAVRRLPAHERPSVVYTAHGFHFYAGGHLLANLFFRTAERVAGRWTDRLIIMNDDDESEAQKYRLVPSQRLIRMRGIGVDTSHYAAEPDSPDDESRSRPV